MADKRQQKKDLYECLRLSRDASPDDIKQAYRELAREKHPDKGGTKEEFQEIQEAYDVLKDDKRRQMYDMTGNSMDGPNEDDISHVNMAHGIPFNFMPGMGPFGIPGVSFDFSDLFGGARGPGPMKMEKGPNKQHDIGLSFKDFYNGKELNLQFKQSRKCTECNGSGSEKSEICSGCKGGGKKSMMRMLGPGIMAATTGVCNQCNGVGKKTVIVCKRCNGKCFFEMEKVLKVEIKPGMVEGENLVFERECSDSKDFENPGDVILTLRLSESSDKIDWDCDSGNIFYKINISFAQSLLGFQTKLVDHPSGKEPVFAYKKGAILNGAKVKAKGYGMPRKDGTFGNLVFLINVSKPLKETWSPEELLLLETVLQTKRDALEGIEMEHED
jgi:molecular chaperone DnaJ